MSWVKGRLELGGWGPLWFQSVSLKMNPCDFDVFVLHNLEKTGATLGKGSFGRVEEVRVGSTLCAGKIWHESLMDPAIEGVGDMKQRLAAECRLMAWVSHPNIVQFMGISFEENSPRPILVMEKLHQSLDRLIANESKIPLSLKLNILLDVSRGLEHLHSNIQPPIVHRDLTSTNVLLVEHSLRAKIADLGNARIIDPMNLNRTLSTFPGTLLYMPPEACQESSSYGPSLDIFSFGHLALYLMTQVFPKNLLPATYYDATTSELLPRSELERRREYIETLHSLVKKDHPVAILIEKCLDNKPQLR